MQQQQDQYGVAHPHNAGGAPATLFAHQQPWGYGGPPPDMYGASASPLQPRPTMAYPGMMPGGGPPRHHGPPNMNMGGVPYPVGGPQAFYPATSPGPPIQTTASNKGPDGANLFIFHIPNHFTNLDMYQLFCPYGNLLSVRIMVEKDTGRSRGFGFVSYDSPDAAALAIKELNGFAVRVGQTICGWFMANIYIYMRSFVRSDHFFFSFSLFQIGNKRLKVQHKQIRDQQHDSRPQNQNQNQNRYDNNMVGGGNGGGFGRGHMSPSLPPSGPMAVMGWYDNQAPPEEHGPDGSFPGAPPDPQQQQHPEHQQQQQEQLQEEGPPNAGAPTEGSGTDPLASLEPLRQALPEVGSGGE
jgi:RNA recognition motif-containing protein